MLFHPEEFRNRKLDIGIDTFSTEGAVFSLFRIFLKVRYRDNFTVSVSVEQSDWHVELWRQRE
mgnify:CR=1 FL=1